MKNKNIIYFYRDWIYLTEELSTIQKGYVWDWFTRYINDLEPSFPTDEASKGVCIVLKGILKRDLAKWNAESTRRSEAGKKGMEKRWQQSEEITNDNKNNNVINVIPSITQITSDNKNNNVNDIDIVKDIDIDIKKEEEKNIYTLTKFLEELQMLLGYAITGKNGDVACKLYEEYGYKTAMYEIKKNIDKKSPIGYTYQVLLNQKPQADESGSEWLDNLKKGMRENKC